MKVRHLSERRRGGLLKAAAQGLGLPPEQHPKILRPASRRASEAERRRFLELQKKRDARAAELGLDPSLIASRAVLSDLARDRQKHEDELMVWQRELLA